MARIPHTPPPKVNHHSPSHSPKRSFKEVAKKKDEEKSQATAAHVAQMELKSPFEVSGAKLEALLPAGLEEVAAALEQHTMTLLKQEGVMRMETTYMKEGSIFDGLEIRLHHFDIAPDAFHIDLYGSPEAARLLDAQVGNLLARLEQGLPGIKVHIDPPFIRTEKERLALLKSKKEVLMNKTPKVKR